MADKETIKEATKPSEKVKKYIGPDYRTRLIVGKGSYDPKSWDLKKIEKMIRHDPALTKYFN